MFDSYMLAEEDLQLGQLRLLEVRAEKALGWSFYQNRMNPNLEILGKGKFLSFKLKNW